MTTEPRSTQIQQALALLCEHDQVVELRVPGTSQGTHSGYFDDKEVLEAAALQLDGQGPGIYITINPINPTLLARGVNRMKNFVKQGESTSDKDILSRRCLPIDFDSIRPAGISSTDEEHSAAINKAVGCREWLSQLGWPIPILADSGNGAHLPYGVDLPNDDPSKKLLERCLKALGARFDDEAVKVDQTTYNASRIWKLYGTKVCKGDHLPDRPHRMAQILEAPEYLEPVPLELLQQLADMSPVAELPEPRIAANSGNGVTHLGLGDYSTLDVVSWFEAHANYGVDLHDGNKHSVICPWVDQHSDQRAYTDSDTVVWQAQGGQWPGFYCSHNHCKGQKLTDVMELWGDADSYCAKAFQPPRNGHHSPDSTPTTSPPLYRDHLSEVRLPRVNAGALQQRVLNGEIPDLTRLPLLGVTDSSPIIKGWSHMLVGYPKTGKTELLTRNAAEWSKTGFKVGYFTEEPESVWTARLSKLPVGFENVDLVYAMGAKAEEILAAIKDGADDVVILDTIRLLQLQDENANAEINIALTPFITVCRQKDSTLVLSHHTRKGSGEHGEAAAGGHAFLGIVDVALELHRDKQASRRRVLKGWGRVIEVPDLVYELEEDGTMKLLGDRALLDLNELKDRITEVLTNEWQPTKDIEEAIGEPKPSRDSMTRALEALAKTGGAERTPLISEGSRPGKKYTWKNLTSASPSLKSGGEVDVPEPSTGPTEQPKLAAPITVAKDVVEVE